MHLRGRKLWLGLIATALLTPSLTGCQNNTRTGALAGTGLGALAGAIIGHQSGEAEKGALIGGLVGGLGGGTLGHAEDMADQRDAALQHAAHVEASRAAAARAISNSDVITMTQQGISEPVIINAIRTQGGHFRTSPEAIIALKNAGVSPNVIMAVQQTGGQY